jgi:hypothetical protein
MLTQIHNLATLLPLNYQAEYRRFLSAQASPDIPPNTSLVFLCELPQAEAAYLASIVIDLHTTLYILNIAFILDRNSQRCILG